MINTVVLTGKIVDVLDGCEQCTLCVIEVGDEQYYILFDPQTIPDPFKILQKYVCITGYLKNFKFKLKRREDYTIALGIFVRRLEVYDI